MLGPCIPCYCGNHEDCVGAVALLGCDCRDRNHQPNEQEEE